MEVESCVAVTHFINPHLFWYKTIEAPGDQFHVLSDFEQSLLELYKNKPSCDSLLRPQKGDKVAVNFIAWNKFIRAEILQKAEFQQEEYIVWATDYGFPLLTKKEYLRNLPTNLQSDTGYVKVGGIANVYPAEQEYDDMEGNLVMIKKEKWLQKTCNMLEKLLADANSISFFKRYQTENGHTWGDLIIMNHKGIQINARDYLLKTTNALEGTELTFRKDCSSFKTTKIAPWLSNDRNTKWKFNNIKHNYIEHSKQMNAVLVDENAKRKVEDWQQRNERNKTESASDFEASFELAEENIDDVAFDDSVSAVQQEVNYIGKAGILTKIKQRKYSSEKSLPPSVLPEFFEINDMMFSGGDIERLPVSKKEGIECLKYGVPNFSNIQSLNVPPSDLESNSSYSIKQRQKNLFEMRKKIARAEKEKQMNKASCLSTFNQSESNNSTLSISKMSDSHPYQLLDQSLTTLTLSNIAVDNVQDNRSELSVKNVRVKHLMAMRKKFGCSTISSSVNFNQLNDTTESLSIKPKAEETLNRSNTKPLSNTEFQLKPKTNMQPENTTEQLPQIYSVNSTSKTEIKENLKSSKAGYDSLTMVPAGYDIDRLRSYKDEKNHWHRKKSTRNDYVPHDNTSSTDELLNNTNDGSFASNNGQTEANAKQTKRQDSPIDCERKVPSSELSMSSNASLHSQRLRKRRQLKSPNSQLSKIDRILSQHCIEKEMGNKNILDLQLLNTSSSSQKSLLSSTSSNISLNSNEIVPSVSQSNIIDICSSYSSSSIDKIRSEKVYKDVLNYEALMDVKKEESLPIMEGERKIQTKYIDHLVLAHSSIQLSPIENVAEAPFLPEIHEEMRQMRVNKVFRIQVYSWSHVSRNNSLFVVNPSSSGKTWSYLPPLCSLICCRKESYKPSYGPVAIILVASLKHVELVNRYCRRLMSGFRNEAPTCIPSYGMRNLNETKIHLLNGCGLLVATPSSLLRLLHENKNEHLFDPDRLQHIVIDDMDIMMARSKEDFESAYSILFKMVKKSKFNKLSTQLIVTSRDWDGLMVKFIRKSNQPLILIGDFLEAAVYGHATISIKLKSNTDKNATIVKFLKEISESSQGLENRTLIICNEDEEVQNVYKFLHDYGFSCLSYFSRSTESERITIDEWKKKISSQILVSTDARFCELKIQNVNNLIHYSMPTSWTQFTFRFSALARTYNNYVSQFEHSVLSTASIANKNNAYSMILLDENNNIQLPRLVDFMRKHNQKVKDEIQAVSKRVLIMREEQRVFNPLCPQLLEFGECDEPRCDYRHELTRFDIINKKDQIPCNGEIRLHVLKVYSPTYYAVRLLQHKSPNSIKWCETRRSSEALTFSVQLNKHYSSTNNLFLHWPPHINDICIYQYAENYRRARILEAPTIKEKETNIVQANLKVTLRLIDDGSVISSVTCNEIFVCDEKFKDFPAQAIDIRLIKVVPFDNERSWDSKTTKQVQKWIIEDIKSDFVVQASIDFAYANTIWVKNIVVMEKLNGIDAYRQVVNLKKSLVEKNFGVLYNGDRKQLRDLAEQFDALNSCQNDVDTGDSDLDYQSCKNESVNLINFSSSNEETTNSSMESAETSLDAIKQIENKSKEIKSADALTEVLAEDTENWDHLDSGRQQQEASFLYT